MANILRAPYIKPKGFCPNPVAKFGIPKEADSILNPRVMGTKIHQEYWEEQLYYILNGYETGGMKIPGRYYYFLNFVTFDTVAGVMYPMINDLHLELAYFADYCKQAGKNAILPKKRRGGLSEFGKTMIMDYGWRFHVGYKGGIAAAQEAYVQDFMEKWSSLNERIVPEFKIKLIANNKDEKVAGWKAKDEDGFRKYGTGNAIYARTMFNNPNMFKGLYLNDVIAEEAGEFENLKQFFEATKHCMMFGSVQVGNFWVWGTGDKDSKGNAVFEEMWHGADKYNMERFFIPANRFHLPFFGGAKDITGTKPEQTPNLQHLTEEERIGVEDTEAAQKDIDEMLAKLLASGDVDAYIKEKQNNPNTPEDVFAGAISAIFDHEILNDTGYDISSKPPQYTKYKLVPKKNDLGELILPYQIDLIPAKDQEKEEECVLIADDCVYLENSTRLYAGGIDSYNLDNAKTTKSLGAMCVYVRDNDIPNYPKNKVAAVIRCRPERKEIFYDMCLYLSAYYNLIGTTLIDTGADNIIEHYKSNHGRKYLAKRPLSAEKDDSQLTHDYGLKLTKYSRKYMEGIMQSNVKSYGKSIVFKKLIEELKVYKEAQIDSDNDLADAYGIALVQNIEMGSKPPTKKQADERKSRLSLNSHLFDKPKTPTTYPITKDI